MNTETKTVWTRVDGKKPKREAVLVGRQISAGWLSGSVYLTQARLAGDMKQSFSDLIAAAKDARLNLPVVSLRTALVCRMDNVVTLDKDLGLVPGKNGGYPCAIELYTPADEDLPVLRETLVRVIQDWIMDDVEMWAERNGMGKQVSRLREAVTISAIDLRPIQVPYIGANSQPNYPLIARSIGERLIGEELFEGLGPCELVASPEYRSNSVELMTLPRRGTVRDEVYSMVARLAVASVPYSKEVYLTVSAMKRVWAKKPPTVLFGTSSIVTAYVVAVGRPANRVSVVRTENGWEFGEEYAALMRESDCRLPANLNEAVAQREFNAETGWWSGLPELPSLFRSVSPRTVFESDEISLLQAVSALLEPIVSGKAISYREVKLPRFQAKPRQEMLRLSDFGVAGAAFNAGVSGEDDEDEELDQDAGSREEKLERYREQNIEALKRVHGATMPVVWMMGGTPAEQELTRRTIGILFGDAIEVSTEALPKNTHGLRADLDHPEYPARKRFDERVKRWQPAADTIKRVSANRHVAVLICATDRVGKKPEDAVNYYAGIHAMSLIGANVHHVLPIENPDDPKSKQSFLHRVQSALLDVMLAHTGAVFGVREFVSRLLPVEHISEAIYGVQAVRSRAQSRSGQTGVNFVLFSRIVVESGMTEVRIGYRDASKNKITGWMPLSQGLSWMGSQRRLQDGDANWLKGAFPEITRQVLGDIRDKDPRAVVLIEWDSVRSLWRGISDVDLGSGNPPRLEAANLAQFKEMAFIRLRRGGDTLSLRTMVKATFKGWKESGGVLSDSGEIKPDTYVTTDMRLVEIADDSLPEERNFGHYIASMGYAKTVQVKRGFSCYRTMSRMSRMGKGLTEFEQKILDVASMDAALPAPMDVSVMASPAGMEPKQYAVLTMGLRLGYAHYNDWTTLPMPLFFRRKIEDYVIRYPEGTEGGEGPGAGEVIGEVVPEQAINPTRYSELVVQEAEGIREEMPPQDDFTPDVLGEPWQEDGADLLSRVRRTPMLSLAAKQDLQSRQLYQCMIKGEAHVRVELPYWVRIRGIFAISGEVTKRRVRRSWGRMQDFGYVKSGVPMPRIEEYMDELAKKLHTPQACFAIIPVTREIGLVSFREMVELIEHDYNTSVPQEERVAPFLIDEGMLDWLAKWADAKQHDELMGWLLFMVTQLPNPDWPAIVIRNLYAIPGPRTEHALEYYLACASAINAALEQKNNRGHITVLRELPKPKIVVMREPVSAAPQEAQVHQGAALTKETPVAQPEAAPQMEPGGDLVMATKKTLIQLIEEIEPGSDSFEVILSQIQAQISTLSEVHIEKKSLIAVASAMAEKMGRFVERQKTVAEQINAMYETLALRVGIREVSREDLEAAMDELSRIEEAITNLSALLKQLDELEHAPMPASLQDRKKRKDVEQQITENAVSRAEGVRSLLQDGICFSVEVPDEPSPGEMLVEAVTEATVLEVAAPPTAMDNVQESPVVSVAVPSGTSAAESAQAGGTSPTATAKTEPSHVPPAMGKEPKAISVATWHPESKVPEKTVPHVAITESLVTKDDDKGYSDEAEVPMGTAAFETRVDTLRTLLQRRLYGLADVHVAAIGSMIEGSGDQELQVHHAILAGLVRALDSMDCQFSFDIKLNSKLNEFLLAEKLPSGAMSDPAHMALGILASGLGNMLFDVSDVQWRIGNAVSACFKDHKALSGLVEHLDLIRQRGFALTRDLFLRSRIGDKNAIELELNRFQKRAENWKRAPDIHSNFNHRGFIALHDEMFSPNSPFGKCLAFIARGDAGRAAAAFEDKDARRKFEKPAQTVDELFKRMGERTKPIGLYRVQVIENIETTEKFVASYLDHVRRRDDQSAELSRDVQSFLDGLNRKLTEAISETRKVEARTDLEAMYCDSAIKAFECAIRLFDTQDAAACIPNNQQKLLIQWPIGKDLMPAMNRLDNLTPPLCTPDDVFEQTRRLAEENLTFGDPSSDDDIDKALADAYQGHLAAKRFLPAFLIEPMLSKSMLPKGLTLLQQYSKERDALMAELQEARQKVAHAMTLSALPQEETNRMQWLIEELMMLCRIEKPIGRPEVESATYPDFPQARAALRCNVLQPLDARLSEAKSRLENELAEEETRGLLPVADIVRIRNLLVSSNAATLRTAHDALAMLRQSGKLPARILDGGNLADEYDAFMDDLKKSTGRNKHLLDAMREMLSTNQTTGNEPEWLARLDADQRIESVQLIDAWLDFFAKRNPGRHEITERLFRSLGITIPPVHFAEHARGARARFLIDDKALLFPTTADDPMFIPPVLGSWATNTQCYALFGTIQENDIRQVLQEAGNTPTLVMARTHLNMQKRAKVSGNSPVILLDDDLLAYVALHPSERLQSLIKVGMLTFTANPYDDYNTKPVPPEMFFGRKEELERLRGVKGLAVLYGGRRLGKSSLLSQITQESRNAPGQEAVYVSMDTVNTVGDYVLSAWEFIYRALVNRKIIHPMGPLPLQWKPIMQHVEKELIDSPKVKSLFLLIDEADNLMGCELRRKRDEDSFVRGLTQLSDNVAHGCLVRMVIAGLHNMTRMANDENSVFGKAEPIPLKPFSSADDVQRGIRLITKPLAAMGYIFGPGAEDLPLRILSVCNFYPAFIQLYCKRLVEHLQNNRQDKKPPYLITSDVLDVVEKDNNLLSELREKFKLNLNLDKRYKAIALILADVYYTEIETGQYNGLTTSELREHCEAYCSKHFENTGPGVYEALLDEMSKLNVVEKVGARYVLRNPNIAMMVGDRDRVTTLINELANEPPETSRNQGERRILMTRNNAHMVFPMPMSWIRNHMDPSDGELLILTGNALSGIMDLARVERDEWRLQDGVFVSVAGNSPQNLSDLVAKGRRISQDPRAPKIMSLRNSAWRVDQIPEYAAIANKASKVGIRIILLAHPERALEIAEALESGKLQPGTDTQRAWRVVPIPPWTDDAIYYWVHENIRVAESREAIAAIRAATCGFGKEVVDFCTQSLTLEGAMAAPEARRKVLASSLDAFHQHIGMPPSLIVGRGEAIKDFLEMMHGVDRGNFADIEERMQAYKISEHMFLFLYWMALIQEGPEHTWVLPKLYTELVR